MTMIQAEEITIRLLKPFFAYARKRCATIEDAEDLTQETVLRLLRTLPKRDDLQDAERYCWTVVHNMVANYYRSKAKSGYGEITEIIPDDFDIHRDFERKETERRLYSEIAYLSKTQRQVVILFYYENMKQQAIADKLGISLAMVKWHLSESKTELRRGMNAMKTNNELTFNPIRFDIIGCNGSTGAMGHNANFLRSSLSQNILYAVRNEAMTVNGIAEALGVSPVYVESEADFLADNCFLHRMGISYISNCLIDVASNEMNRLHDEMYSKAAELIAPELFDALSGIIRCWSGFSATTHCPKTNWFT